MAAAADLRPQFPSGSRRRDVTPNHRRKGYEEADGETDTKDALREPLGQWLPPERRREKCVRLGEHAREPGTG